MDTQSLYIILIIVGCFLSLGMAINAFFLKGIYDRLGTVEIAQATIFADGKSREKRITKLEENEKVLFERINKMEGQI